MIRFIDINHSEEWDRLVTSLQDYDIYYLSGYVKAFKLHGDGDPTLIWWEYGNVHGACVIMIRDVADDRRFSLLEHGRLFDAVTPYGYGGFIFSGTLTEGEQAILSHEFSDALKSRSIISVFFRFHPVLANARFSRQICEVYDLGKTISMNLTDADIIWSNITSKNRNVIRKAEKSEVEIHHSDNPNMFKVFKEIYNETMRGDNAEEYYFFEDEFYESIANDLAGNYEIFYATHEDKIISIAIIIFANNHMHYHLSGSLRKFRPLAPSNLLLYKAALWGYERGFKTFHLGGGVGSGETPLYKFKAAFNRNSDCQFSIGKLIVDESYYQTLVDMRVNDYSFNPDSQFFPLYRS